MTLICLFRAATVTLPGLHRQHAYGVRVLLVESHLDQLAAPLPPPRAALVQNHLSPQYAAVQQGPRRHIRDDAVLVHFPRHANHIRRRRRHQQQQRPVLVDLHVVEVPVVADVVVRHGLEQVGAQLVLRVDVLALDRHEHRIRLHQPLPLLDWFLFQQREHGEGVMASNGPIVAHRSYERVLRARVDG
ncbi:DUF2264 domain-containing protein [Babesia caballi]|uniref:DUF2264 domain-containing protein n=1 Tax=Babesia caballi TaxID=5871 RepID=A0AAV4M0D8_BABCB|nr:DUF2264 domain-containing protein [Babesia caballi]